MTSRVISEWETTGDKGKAVVKYSSSDEQFYIDYYDNHGKKFFSEDFPDKTIQFVEDAAQNWTLGIKKLDEVA